MKAYFDTSFLVSAYVRDANSAKVAAVLKTRAFYSFDRRQVRLAADAGLKALPA